MKLAVWMTRVCIVSSLLLIALWVLAVIHPPFPRFLWNTFAVGWHLAGIGILTLPYLILIRLLLMEEDEVSLRSLRRVTLVSNFAGLLALQVIKPLTPNSDLAPVYDTLLIVAYLLGQHWLSRRVRREFETAQPL